MPHLILFAGLASSIAVGTLIVRRLFTTGDNAGVRMEQFGLSLGFYRPRLELNMVIALQGRRFNVSVRYAVDPSSELAVLLMLLLLRSQAWPIFLPLLEDIEVASIFYLRARRFPRFAGRIVDAGSIADAETSN